LLGEGRMELIGSDGYLVEAMKATLWEWPFCSKVMVQYVVGKMPVGASPNIGPPRHCLW
jgi:hypothetical protein